MTTTKETNEINSVDATKDDQLTAGKEEILKEDDLAEMTSIAVENGGRGGGAGNANFLCGVIEGKRMDDWLDLLSGFYDLQR